MIIKTTSPDKLRQCLSELKKRGYTQIESGVRADWHSEAENFIEADRDFMIWAYVGPAKTSSKCTQKDEVR